MFWDQRSRENASVTKRIVLSCERSWRLHALVIVKEEDPMAFHQRYHYRYYLAAFCFIVLILMLSACDAGVGGTSPTQASTTSFPKPDSSPKGPGGLTATVGSSNCSFKNTAPASTSGWKVYKDSRFPFKFAVPPDWRAGSFVDDSGNDYIVQVFPPESSTPVGQAGLADQEHFSVTVALVGSASTYANDPNWSPEAGNITINGVKTTLYDRTSPECGEVNRGATADFEQHHFTFFVTSIPTKAKVDIALFQSMLHSFIYTQP